MKIPIFVFLALLAAPLIKANTTRSAQYYLNTPEKFEGKNIVLYTAYVLRRAALDKSDSVFFSAYTMSRDENDTAFINVVVPKSEAEKFAKKYGSSLFQQNNQIRKLPMAGVFRQINDIWFLDYGAKP